MIPLAGPPIEVLHGIDPILFIFDVTSNVFNPILEGAKLASIPACPPPTTITSYISLTLPFNSFPLYTNIAFLTRKKLQFIILFYKKNRIISCLKSIVLFFCLFHILKYNQLHSF